MEFNQQDNNKNSIISVGKGTISLSHATLNIPCFVSSNYYLETPDLTLETLDKLTIFPLAAKDSVNLLLIGTGEVGKFLPPKQQVAIQKMGIGVETMRSDSACRSFNLLLSDVRQVGLLLL